MNKKKKVLIYTRVSTELQGKESLENQKQRCLAFLETHPNLEIHYTYSDIASGGKDNRDGIKKVISLIEQKKIDAIVVTELSRISRKMNFLVNFFEIARNNNIEIIAILNNIDTSTIHGQSMMLLMGVFAEMERENIKSRVRHTMLTKASSGHHTGGVAPFGYDLMNKKLVINPQTSKIVKEIYKNFALGESYVSLSRKYSLAVSTIARILTSETYIGTKVYGKRKVNSDGNIIKAEEENIKKIPDSHPPIIERDLFFVVQRMIMTSHEKYYKSRKEQRKKFLFYGLLKCYHNHSIGGQVTTAGSRFYSCSSNNKKVGFTDKKRCSMRNINAEKLEHEILQEILTTDFSKLDENASKYTKQKEMEILEKEVIKLENVKNRIVDLYLEGTLSKEELEKRKSPIDIKRKALQAEIQIIVEEIKRMENISFSKNILNEVTRRLSSTNSFEEKQELIHLVIEKIQFINDFEYEIHFKI